MSQASAHSVAHCVILVALILPGVITTPCPSAPATVPATVPTAVADAIQRLLTNPRDEKQREPFKDQRLQDEAWPILEAAVRRADPKRLIGGIILPSDDPSNVLEAMAYINGIRATPLVLETARSGTYPRMRWEALGLITYPLKLDTPAARKVALTALADADGEVVSRALQTLGEIGDAEAGPAILAILRNPPAKIWRDNHHSDGARGELFERALDSIGHTGYAGATDDLLALLEDQSAKVRQAAARSLGGCASNDKDGERRQKSADRLATLLEDFSPFVRSAAAEAMAELGDKRCGPALAYDLRANGVFDPAHPPRGYLRLWDTVRHLEKLTGASYGASLGREAWDLYADPDKAEQLAPIVSRVKSLVADLKTRGITPEGYPKFPQELSVADRKLIDGWFDRWLIDPRGGKLISFTFPRRTCWGSVSTGQASGWLFPAKDAKPARVLLDDGAELPPPEKFDAVDLVGDAKQIVEAVRGAGTDGARPADNNIFPPTPPGQHRMASCINAAWLYRLGEERLAAELLFVSRASYDSADEQIESIKASNAWDAFSTGVSDYIARDDDRAYAHLDRLRRLYPNYLDRFGAGTRLLAELERRRKDGTFVAHAPPATMPTEKRYDPEPARSTFSPPAGFDQWPVEKRVAWLIHDLQELDARQRGQPGGVDVSSDPRVEALVKIGEPAVPALIDCIEHDDRLTRAVSFWRDFAQNRTLIGVRECALSAVESILGTSVFEPASTGDSFSGRGEDHARHVARQLRAYWERYGKLPYTQRMMTILTDPKCTTGAARSAASALAHANEERRFGTMIWTGGAKPKPGENPVIKEFSNPTVAEAILVAYDRALVELENDAKQDDARMAQYERGRVKDECADLLMTLQDRRITPALVKRFDQAKTAEDGRRWALTCFALAEERPMRFIAEQFKAGAFELGKVDPKASDWFEEPGNRELTEWVSCLHKVTSPLNDQAIGALADPKHPYHARATEMVQRIVRTSGHVMHSPEGVWTSHPVLFRLARPLLDDRTPTGRRYRVYEGKRLREEEDRGFSQGELPAMLANPADRNDTAGIRVCDAAAVWMSKALIGAPAVHPLFKDADARLDAFRKFLDNHESRIRPLPYHWGWVSGLRYDDSGPSLDQLFYPDLLIAGRPAKPDDVAAKRAVFALKPPGGKPDDRSLPMAAKLHLAGRPAEPVLVIQAERDADGKMHYGVLARHAILEVAEEQLSELKVIERD